MKISFSTLGCPEWSFEDIVVTAKDLGMEGIEIRGIENELYVPNAKPFTEENLQKTKDKLKQLNIEVPCLTSSCFLFDKQNQDYYLKEGKDYIDLASELGTPFVRVLGDMGPDPKEEIDAAYVAENLWILAKYAESKNVKVLVETNGFFADSEELKKLMVKVESPNVGVLWDIHHPYRFMNEPAEKTYNTLKEYISFIHVKDSMVENGKLKYKMLGYGDVPVKEVVNLLKSNNYDGYISLEWVKRWCIDLEEPGIVFSHYVNHMKDLIG